MRMTVPTLVELEDELRKRLVDMCELESRTQKYYVSKGLTELFDRMETPKKTKAVDDNTEADILIDHLNMRAGKKYRYTASARKLINARLKDYSYNDVCTVIDKKCLEWKGGTMEKYLRPTTLFNATKFDEYLNQGGCNEKAGIQSRENIDFNSDFIDEDTANEVQRRLNERNS